MKSTVIGAILVCLFGTGCEQSGILETPSAISSETTIGKEADGAGRATGVISLDGMVVEPSGFNVIDVVSGEIAFSYASSGGANATCNSVSIHLSASGEVLSSTNNENPWSFVGESDEIVCVGTSGAMFENAYSLEGRQDGVMLHVRLLVEQNNTITLDHMWLESHPHIVPAD